MNYISIENISKNYGEKVLFANISFGINKGEKVALVANNGSGKTTLLRILTGDDVVDSGSVTVHPGINISLLPQEPFFNSEMSVNEVINSAELDIVNVIKNYNNAIQNQSDSFTRETQKALEHASAQMDAFNAWEYERRLKQLLDRFKITNLEQRIGTMSGGQIKRLSLALTLLDKPDVLLLDEPTNHLDIEMIEWLESELQNSAVTLFMVTHDRYFLDRVCNVIIELNDGKLFRHNGNYSYFLEKKAGRENVERVEIDKARKLMKKELDWMRRMPKARTTKSKARIDSYYITKEKATSAKRTDEIKLSVSMSRVGSKILEMNNVNKSYGDIVILNNFDYIFKKGDRIGIVGKNGVGKTSFLNLIMHLEEPDSGSVISGETIVFGYYKQEGIKINKNQTVLEVVKDIAEIIPTGKGQSITASQLLHQFMFPSKVQNDYVSKLSGGELRRLYLLTVLIKNPNFLILDEPTNDLDLLTLNKLEEFLENYSGCLILVSHDRYFLDHLTNHIFVFEGDGNIVDYHSNYSNYRLLLDKKSKKLKSTQNTEKKIKNKSVETTTAKNKLTYKEKKEYDLLMSDIDALEMEKKIAENKIQDADADYEKLTKLSVKIGKIIDEIDEKTLRWMELDEYI